MKVKYLVREDEEGQRSHILKIYIYTREKESEVHRSSTEDTTNSWLTLLKVKYLVREDEEGQRSPILKISNIVFKSVNTVILMKRLSNKGSVIYIILLKNKNYFVERTLIYYFFYYRWIINSRYPSQKVYPVPVTCES